MAVTYTYDAPTGDETSVDVTFTDGTVTHQRSVNAVFTDDAYDADATEDRVAEVARGVENKIAVGAISQPEEAAEEEAAEEESE
jgi:hypothetical protein